MKSDLMGPWVRFIASTVLYLMEVDVFALLFSTSLWRKQEKDIKKSSIEGVMRFDASFTSIFIVV